MLNNQNNNLSQDKIDIHLGLLQGIISRMSDASLRVREMCITMIAAILAFFFTVEIGFWYRVALIVIILFGFSLLDCFYYRKEKLYRKLYEDIIADVEPLKLYSLKIPNQIDDDSSLSFWKLYFSRFILCFYLALCFVAVVLLLIQHVSS